MLIAVIPQMVGFLLQRTLRAAQVASESTTHSGFLANMHPIMIWGVDQVWSLDLLSNGASAAQLMQFLSSLKICSPVIPGASVFPSVLPKLPPPGATLELSNIVSRRVYVLGYLPSFLPTHLTGRILQALYRNNVLVKETSVFPQSPTSSSPRAQVPIVTPTGAILYLWQDNFILEDHDGSKLFIKILKDGALGPESTPFCGRIDVLLEAKPMKEAFLLRLVTTEIDLVRL